jgi:hypothetical protein
MASVNILLAILGGIASNPGLIPVPLPRSFPGPIAGIRVLDAETGANLGDAQVRFRTEPFGNWMARWPVRFGEGGSAAVEADQAIRSVKVVARSDGLFVPRRTWRLHTVLVTLPGPLGSTLHFDHFVTIEVSAPGRRPVWLMYYPANPPKPGWSETQPWGTCCFTAAGILEFRLPPEPPSTPRAQDD